MDANVAGSPRLQLAATTLEHILLDNILLVTGLFLQCVGIFAEYHCASWYLDVPLVLGRPIMGRSGYGIVVQLRDRAAPAHSPVLLQLSQHLTTGVPIEDPEAPVTPSWTCRCLRSDLTFNQFWNTSNSMTPRLGSHVFL